MLVKPGDRGGMPTRMKILSGGSLKKATKWEGRLATRATQQARKIHSMIERDLKEWLRRDDGAISNAEIQRRLTKFDATIESQATKLRKLTTRISEQGS